MNPGGRALKWTQPNDYTGGDVGPVPLRNGALLYTKYSIDDRSEVHAQVWIQRRPGSPGLALTAPDLGCAQPAVSPDERLIAMVCSKGSNQSSDLVVAPFDPDALTVGAPSTLVRDKLVASPAFSPDGKTIAFPRAGQPGRPLPAVDRSGLRTSGAHEHHQHAWLRLHVRPRLGGGVTQRWNPRSIQSQ